MKSKPYWTCKAGCDLSGGAICEHLEKLMPRPPGTTSLGAMRSGVRIEEAKTEDKDDPLGYTQEREFSTRLAAWGLTREEIEVFCLRYLDNYSWAEIAAVEGWISPDQVRLRVLRIRRALAERGFRIGSRRSR